MIWPSQGQSEAAQLLATFWPRQMQEIRNMSTVSTLGISGEVVSKFHMFYWLQVHVSIQNFSVKMARFWPRSYFQYAAFLN